MDATIEVPAWFFVAYLLIQVVLYVLDSIRARLWNNYIKQVNKILGDIAK